MRFMPGVCPRRPMNQAGYTTTTPSEASRTQPSASEIGLGGASAAFGNEAPKAMANTNGTMAIRPTSRKNPTARRRHVANGTSRTVGATTDVRRHRGASVVACGQTVSSRPLDIGADPTGSR